MLAPPLPASLPRILHVAETARGGVGTYLAELLPEQVALYGADHVRALVPASDAAHVAGVDRRVLVPWRRRGRSPGSLARLAAAIRREVAAFRPSVVHAHSSFAGLVVRAMFAGRRGRPAIVYCPHGWGFDRVGNSLANGLAGWTERALAPWCDRIVVISDHERRRGIEAGIDPDRLTLVHNGIADAAPPPPARWDDARLKLLFVGRLDRQKGVDTLLDAIAPLAERVSLRVVGAAVAGGGAGRRQAAHVAYLGWRSLAEVEAEITAADVVVVPSRWEGFGLVAVEAMRGKCAVVATAVGGLPEIVVDGVTGRLVPPDSPVDLMRALIEEPRERWRAMGEAGRERYLARFTADRMARRLAALYRDLDAGAPVPRPPWPRQRAASAPAYGDA